MTPSITLDDLISEGFEQFAYFLMFLGGLFVLGFGPEGWS